LRRALTLGLGCITAPVGTGGAGGGTCGGGADVRGDAELSEEDDDEGVTGLAMGEMTAGSGRVADDVGGMCGGGRGTWG
jgi:hypothetical protein